MTGLVIMLLVREQVAALLIALIWMISLASLEICLVMMLLVLFLGVAEDQEVVEAEQQEDSAVAICVLKSN